METDYTPLSDLMQEMGLTTPKDAKALVKDNLVEGEHYRSGFQRRLELSKSGVDKLKEVLGLRTPTPDGEPVKATLMKLPVNPHLLFGILEDGRVIRIRVKTQDHFRPGMKVQCKPAKDLQPDIFAYVGLYPRGFDSNRFR